MDVVALFYLVSGICSIGALGAAFFFYNMNRKLALLKTHEGMSIDAPITKKEKREGKNNDITYVVGIQFNTTSGEIVENNLNTSLAKWKDLEIGDTLPIRYLRNNPKTICHKDHIDSGLFANRLVMWAMLAATVLFPFCIFLSDYFGTFDPK